MTEQNTEAPKPSYIRQIVLGLVVLGVVGWVVYSQIQENQPNTNPNTNQMKTYQSGGFGFTVSYPQNWRTEECTDNASTLIAIGDREQLIVCSSDAPLNAYVLVGAVTKPYWEGTIDDQVTLTQTAMDDSQVTDITVDGVAAKRVQGKLKDFTSEFPQQVAPGTLIIQVIFIKDDRLYRVNFQDLAGTNSTAEFDEIVENFKFN